MDNPQPKVLETEYGWFAGFFDGEGTVALSIRMSRSKRDKSGPALLRIQPLVKLSGTDSNALNYATHMMDKAGIAYHVAWYEPKGKMRNGNAYKTAWDITIAGHKRCRRFCEWLTPALVCKKERAEILLDFLNERAKHFDPRRTPPTETEVALVIKMRELNMRGKAQPFSKAMTQILAERPVYRMTDEMRARLAENGRKGAASRWGIQH